MNIGSSLSSYTRLFSPFQESVTVASVGDNVLTLAFNKDSSVLILSYDKWFIASSVLQQVKELLVVDLQERAVNCVIPFGVCLDHDFEGCKDLLNRSRNYTEFSLVIIVAVDVSVEHEPSHSVLPAIWVVIPVGTEHGIGLSRACLTVGKDSGVKPAHDIFD